MGYEFCEIWECEWTKMKSENKDVQDFLKEYRHGHIMKRKVSDKEILDSVLSGELFGMLEVDIHVPDELKEHFEDLPPIFKNTKVKLDDIDKLCAQ